MATVTVSREQQIEQIAEALMREFQGELPPDLVLAEVTHCYGDLCASSRVEAFIPILAMRRARVELRAVAHHN